jgi:uncharacterized OB-fold protein
MGAHVSVVDYFRSIGTRVRLESRVCVACTIWEFPIGEDSAAACGHPGELRRLSGFGTLYSVVEVAGSAAPPELSAEIDSHAYEVALVDLDEGPRIAAQLVDFSRPAAIGDRVRAVTRRLYVEEGVVRYGFKFAPVPDGSAPSTA